MKPYTYYKSTRLEQSIEIVDNSRLLKGKDGNRVVI